MKVLEKETIEEINLSIKHSYIFDFIDSVYWDKFERLAPIEIFDYLLDKYLDSKIKLKSRRKKAAIRETLSLIYEEFTLNQL